MRAHATIKRTLTIGTVSPLQRSLSQQSSEHVSPEAALHAFKNMSELSHCALGIQPLAYALMPLYSMDTSPQRYESAGQSASVCLLLQSSMLDVLLHV